MDYFRYKGRTLFAEDVAVSQIAEELGTPIYIYSKATFIDHLRKIQNAYRQIETNVCYSVKACGNIHILKFLAEAGSGFDIVSGGELYRALHAGADPAKIVFAGVGKTDQEIREAIEARIGYFNVESEAELENLIALASQTPPSRTPIKAALRVNPDIEYATHDYMKTGKKQTKFGVDIEKALHVFSRYGDNPHVHLRAIHVHLGTGGKSTTPYVEAVQKIRPLIEQLRHQGHTIEALDLGGGYGADYESDTAPSPEAYAAAVVPLLKDMDLKLILEPGKSICANAGILLTRVLYIKQSGTKKFVIVDAAMNDLIRPALYNAFHFIWPVSPEPQFVPPRRAADLQLAGTEPVDVVGPVCESGDFFAKDRALPPVKRGDLLAIFTAGAYGFTMSSNYNARPRPPEVLADGQQFSLIRRRETYEDLIAAEKL